MVTDQRSSDDHVASLLSQDAKRSAIKYSALGIQAFLPRRSTTNAPKPNVRFLQNIIRETDNHNTALKAREVAEARRRLGQAKLPSSPNSRLAARKSLDRSEEQDTEERSRKRRRLDIPSRHEDRRNNRVEDGSRRTRTEIRGTTDGNRQRLAGTFQKSLSRIPRRNDHERRQREDRGNSEDGSYRKRKHRSPPRSSSHSRHRHRNRHGGHTTRDESLSAESASDREHRRRCHQRHRSSTSSPERPKSPSDPSGTAKSTTRSSPISSSTRAESDSDSDPLEAIIGPLPPPVAPKVQRRGRGTATMTSMDARFTSTYDPALDVRLNSDSENDWDQALEALRDRTRWKLQGADRLRAAGFTAEEVGKWEKGGEKREEDVRWKGRGEGREWDRGKVLDAEGLRLEVGWARLK